MLGVLAERAGGGQGGTERRLFEECGPQVRGKAGDGGEHAGYVEFRRYLVDGF